MKRVAKKLERQIYRDYTKAVCNYRSFQPTYRVGDQIFPFTPTQTTKAESVWICKLYAKAAAMMISELGYIAFSNNQYKKTLRLIEDLKKESPKYISLEGKILRFLTEIAQEYEKKFQRRKRNG